MTDQRINEIAEIVLASTCYVNDYPALQRAKLDILATRDKKTTL